MNLRHKRGATLGLVAAVALMLVFVGFCIYWVVQMLGGGQQIANATDAGAITAAKFLEQFVGDVPWTHLDIAGPAFMDKPKPWLDGGATACMLRTLVEVARRWK